MLPSMRTAQLGVPGRPISQTYRAAQDQWTDYHGPDARRIHRILPAAWRRMIPDDTDRSLYAAIIRRAQRMSIWFRVWPCRTIVKRHWLQDSGLSLPLDYLLRVTGTDAPSSIGHARLCRLGSLDHPLATRSCSVRCASTASHAYADLWSELYEDAWRDEDWVCHLATASRLSATSAPPGSAIPRCAPSTSAGPRLSRSTPSSPSGSASPRSSSRPSTRPATRSSATTRTSPGSTPPAGSSPANWNTSAPARPRSTGSSSRRTWRTRRRTRPRTATRRRSTRPTGSASTGRRTPPSPSG